MDAFDELLGYVWIVLFAHTGLPTWPPLGVAPAGLACQAVVKRPVLADSSIKWCFLVAWPLAVVPAGERKRSKFKSPVGASASEARV